MGELIIVTGPPGAGKSTVATVLVERFDRSVLIEGDAFFGFLRRGLEPPWLPEAREQNEAVTRAAAAATGWFVASGYAAVYDGVVGPWFLPTFTAAAGLGRLHYVVLLPSVERCVERVSTRTGHGFTDEGATRKMHREFADADVDRRHVFSDPMDDVGGVADDIFEAMTRGDLSYLAPPS